MKSRAEIVDENFANFVRTGKLPQSRLPLTSSEAGLTRAELLDLFESQLASRHLDYAARILKKDNHSYYTIGSAGHEGNAAFGKVFRLTDMSFLHYRSGAFFIQRAKQLPGATPIWDMALSLVASSEDPISQGRHKVFGSVPLGIPPQTSTIASHLPKAVGAALSIPRAKDLGLDATLPYDAVILCSFGDASFNHATAQAAFNTASLCAYQKIPLPVVFICEDNGIGISVKTPDGWIETAARARPEFRYFSCDGRNIADVYRAAVEAENYVRKYRRPAFVHMRTVRLLGHAGSDVESLYHSEAVIEAAERDDPLLHTARMVLEEGHMNAEEVIALYEHVRARVMRASVAATTRPKLETAAKIKASVVPSRGRPAPAIPSDEERMKLFGFDWRYMDRTHHMAKLINWALVDILARYPNTVVFGEDVARKGGVYHVTTGLQAKFGPRRVFDSPLDETSILGNAIGMAHNGFIPIPEIQFLAYVHNAEDQIRGEAATLSFFSSGQYTNPMVVRVAGLAYQKGFGGHFHNDNSLAVFRDLPGVIIACPSNGADAVKMLRTAVRLAHEQGRVVVFVEPIALYMTKDLHEPGDGAWTFHYPAPDEEIPLGEFGVFGKSDRLAIVTYGNGYYLSRQAAKILAETHGIAPKVIDLRWLAPLDEKRLAAELEGVENVLIVDECRRTGSQSEALMTLVAERVKSAPKVARITAEDCFIPLGKGATVMLPSRESIVQAALDLVAPAAGKSVKMRKSGRRS